MSTPLSVRQLLEAVDTAIQRRWPTPVQVEGELAQVSVASSGHAYLTLREASPQPGRGVAQFSAVCWRSTWDRLRHRPSEGQRVVVRGKLGLWVGRGNVQLTVLDIAPAGEGALAKEIAARRARLEEEGLLDPRRKRALPAVPAFVGVATSLQGAALQDFLKVSGRRWPAARILVAGCVVQGEMAPASVAQAVELLLDDGRAEVVVVTRGGGSREDLLAFQDEHLARFLAHCPVPVVSAVGHQVDETLADLVADVAVATPTEAAVHVLPDAQARAQQVDELQGRLTRATLDAVDRRARAVQALQQRLRHPAERLSALRRREEELRTRLVAAMRRALGAARQRVDGAPVRLGQVLSRALPQAGRRVDQAQTDLERAMARLLEARRQRVASARAQLHALGPQRVLARGYAVVTGPGGVLHGPKEAPAGTALTIRLAQGSLAATSDGEAS